MQNFRADGRLFARKWFPSPILHHTGNCEFGAVLKGKFTSTGPWAEEGCTLPKYDTNAVCLVAQEHAKFEFLLPLGPYDWICTIN